jgi:hypothetical protein
MLLEQLVVAEVAAVVELLVRLAVLELLCKVIMVVAVQLQEITAVAEVEVELVP